MPQTQTKDAVRKFTDKKLVLATHNQGKVKEIGALLAPYAIEVVSAGDLNLPEPEETGTTFAENAILKALAAAKAANICALADDSGFAVTALNGDPGLYSARWAGPNKDFQMAMQTVHDKMGDATDRSAAFICVLALAWPDGHTETFEGRIEGQTVWPPRGDKGFGYDPMFQPDGYKVTFAEMSAAEKQTISHRGRAFERMIEEAFST